MEDKCAHSTNCNGYLFWSHAPASQPLQQGSCDIIQFITHYQHSSGQQWLHVMTITCNFTEAGSPHVVASFDQEAAAVLMYRIAVFKAEINNLPDVLRWLDCMLIQICQKFANYRKEDLTIFRLMDNFSIYLSSCSIFVEVSSCRCLTTVQMKLLSIGK